MTPVVKFLTDEDFDQPIMSGLLLRHPNLDIVRVVDSGLAGASDDEVLAYAAQDQRLTLTHDIATMQRFAAERIAQGLPMSGVLEVPRRLSRYEVILQIELIAFSSLPGEHLNRIFFLPLP